MKYIEEINVEGKKVLVRSDFNISLDEEGDLSNDIRIREALPTINYLIKKGAKIILLSHASKEPKKKKSISDESEYILKEGSLYPVKERLSILLKREVLFVDDCIGEKVEKEVNEMKKGDVLLLENVRMYKEEKENSEIFGKEISRIADIYINDAFSVSHRNHASLTIPPIFIPSAYGMLMKKEIKVLEKIQKNPKKPIIAIVGGAKVESKIKSVNYFLENADHILLGGKIANVLLAVRKIASNLPKPSEEMIKIVEEINYTSPKLHLPVDVVASLDNTGEKEVRATAPGKVKKEEDIYDIGKETISLYSDIIREAGTVIWAGPLGLSEKKPFEKGTKEVGQSVIKNSRALKVVAGGDTSKALMQFNLLDKMNHISYGGGAMLTYIRKGKMPGIDALK